MGPGGPGPIAYGHLGFWYRTKALRARYNRGMAKPYPESVPLKHAKCPACGQRFDGELRRLDSVVRADCKAQGCSYGVELYWLGGATVSTN